MGQSLRGSGNPLAQVEQQQTILRPPGRFKPFAQTLAESGKAPLTAGPVRILQINVGRLCIKTCQHCHVDAGPDRTEIMTRATMEDCLAVLAASDIPTVDITGGAPEMNPNFRWLVGAIKKLGRHVIDRCNLTIVLMTGQHDLPDFLARHEVEIVSSLPYFTAGPTDRQRGAGVFDRSIEALRRLNAVGYGKPDGKLKLSLVYNPVGAFLAPPQAEMEQTFKTRLWESHGIEFNSLLVITNQPINRFLDYLLRSGNYENYMERLLAAYNPATVDGLMCRNTLSVDWQGFLFDCDFNQMLDLKVDPRVPQHIRALDVRQLAGRSIVTGLHCYACTAGNGSSCGGETVANPAR